MVLIWNTRRALPVSPWVPSSTLLAAIKVSWFSNGVKCLDWSMEESRHRQDMPSTATNEVYYIDTLCPETGWTRAPPMLIKRSHSHAFALDGKIYVMGGFVSEPGSLPPPPYYAEVFDPSEKESGWQPAFSDIPERLAHGIIIVHQLRKRKRQLLVYGVATELGFRYSYDFDGKEDFDNNELGWLYSYDFDDKRWNLCYKGDFDPRCCYCNTETATLFDDIMYCYNTLCPSNHLYTAPGTIMGFDAKNPNISPKIVRGLEEEKDFLPKPDYYGHFPHGNLLRLGGSKLCLVLEERNYPGLILTFLKFTVSKEHNSFGEVVDLVATHLSKSTFCLQATSIYNYFAMPAFRGSGREEEICCNTSASRTSSPATINDRNEEGSGNATVNV